MEQEDFKDFQDYLVAQYERAVKTKFVLPVELISVLYRQSRLEVKTAIEGVYTMPSVFATWFGGEYALRERCFQFDIIDEAFKLNARKRGHAELYDIEYIAARADREQVKMIAEAFAHYEEEKAK